MVMVAVVAALITVCCWLCSRFIPEYKSSHAVWLSLCITGSKPSLSSLFPLSEGLLFSADLQPSMGHLTLTLASSKFSPHYLFPFDPRPIFPSSSSLHHCHANIQAFPRTKFLAANLSSGGTHPSPGGLPSLAAPWLAHSRSCSPGLSATPSERFCLRRVCFEFDRCELSSAEREAWHKVIPEEFVTGFISERWFQLTGAKLCKQGTQRCLLDSRNWNGHRHHFLTLNRQNNQLSNTKKNQQIDN